MNNDLKRAVCDGEHPLGTWVSIAHPAVVEINAAVGFEFVLLDAEHTTMSYETVEGLVRAAEAASSPTEPVVRVPDNDPVAIKRVLDIGVSSLMVPMVDSAPEAKSVVDAVRYPPEGDRGIAGSRATDYGLAFESYVEAADDAVLTIVQIESREGLANVEAIAAVDGVDALFVGPSDLSGSLGVFGESDADELADAMDKILAAGAATGVPVGTLVVRPGEIERHVARGFDYLIAGKDAHHLATAGQEVIDRYERALETDADGLAPESG